jgi:chromosome partitioning protein
MVKQPIIIAVVNNKGGTGKTTIVFNTAAGLNALGLNVLMVDLDAQANLTMATGLQAVRHVGNLITGDADWDEVLLRGNTPGGKRLDIMPAAPSLLTSEVVISADPLLINELRSTLRERIEYDVILIDCPPSLGSLTKNALVSAHYYIVPMQGENFAYRGLEELTKAVKRVQRNFNVELELAGILRNRFAMNTIFGAQIQQALEDSKLSVFKTRIRQNIGLMESANVNQTIYQYAPNSSGAEDFKAFTNELLTLILPDFATSLVATNS